MFSGIRANVFQTIEMKIWISVQPIAHPKCIKYKIWSKKLFIFSIICCGLFSAFEHCTFHFMNRRNSIWNRRMPKRHWITIWLPLNSVIVFHKTWFSICFVSFLSRYWFLGGDRIAQNCSTFCICLIEYSFCSVHRAQWVSQPVIDLLFSYTLAQRVPHPINSMK